MKVFVSVISHGHSSLIKKLSCLDFLCLEFCVIVKSNKSGDSFEFDNEKGNFHWIDEKYNCGFGENNNIVFSYCQTKLGMQDNDYFIVLNPDVFIEVDMLLELIQLMENDRVVFSAINLFLNDSQTCPDPSIRHFPNLFNFLFSFLGLGNSTVIDKSNITSAMEVDWAAGSFLAFKASHYQSLYGFDENYFMYCEDIDICYRSAKMGLSLTFYPKIKAIHLAKHENRMILSRHFYWHVSSVIRFLISKKFRIRLKSRLKKPRIESD
ncbi:glycosyltransferase family 2 protein [Pectobacterium punjabense]|uniref:glycosyltransferase family 2 protein n=1 Tax=Pectobacterium punjabense TaxID=2108399 RepID=UPI003D9B5C93